MQFRTFGRTGWQVSEVGYGMWGMVSWSGSDDRESLAGTQGRILPRGPDRDDAVDARGLLKVDQTPKSLFVDCSVPHHWRDDGGVATRRS